MKQEHVANPDDNELSLVPDPFLMVSCPFLGVRNDPGTPMGFPTPGNHCFAFKPALQLDLEKQREHCLSDCYTDCPYFKKQHLTDAPAVDGGASRPSNSSRRIVNGRSLALMMMLLLILLAVLIWWPPPGTSMEEGTVFGVSFGLNSPNVESESAQTTEQKAVPQEKSGTEESISAETANSDSVDLDLLDQDQGEGSSAADSGDYTRIKGNFNPIAYGDQGSDSETLIVYPTPDVESDDFLKIARPELVSLLGRDGTAEWIKIRTEGGIEGWVLASETELGSWIESLPEIEPQ